MTGFLIDLLKSFRRSAPRNLLSFHLKMKNDKDTQPFWEAPRILLGGGQK